MHFVLSFTQPQTDEHILCTSILCPSSGSVFPVSLSCGGCDEARCHGVGYICCLLVAFFVIMAVSFAGIVSVSPLGARSL
jgi:hypothetical protein